MEPPHPLLDPATPREAGVVRHLGDADREFTAAREGAGVFDLGHRDRLRLHGPDTASFLNRLLTYEVTALEPGQGVRPFLLDARGRIRAAFHLLRVDADCFWVDAAPGHGERISAALDMYHFGERFEVSPLSQYTAITVQGGDAPAVLRRAGYPTPERPWDHVELHRPEGPIRVVRIDRAEGAGYDLWLAPSTAAACLAALITAGATPCGADALEMLRVHARRADAPAEFGEHASPLELDAFDGLTDAKGCYPGQEVIERTLSLGKPPRKLVALSLDGATTPGASITEGDRAVGTVTSAARLPGGEWVALALIKRRSADAGPWTCGDATARRR